MEKHERKLNQKAKGYLSTFAGPVMDETISASSASERENPPAKRSNINIIFFSFLQHDVYRIVFILRSTKEMDTFFS